jgi:glutaredoxin
MALEIYVKPNCPYCQQARDYYTSNGIDFVEYDAQNDKHRQREMLEYTAGDPTHNSRERAVRAVGMGRSASRLNDHGGLAARLAALAG